MDNNYVWVLEYRMEFTNPMGTLMPTTSLKVFRTKELALLYAGWLEKDYIKKGFEIVTDYDDEDGLSKTFKHPTCIRHGYRLQKHPVLHV